MIYNVNDVNFPQLGPIEFERLCFDLLLKLGYRQLTWRQGGADNGRDIEGSLSMETPLGQENRRYFFECKHYTGGVPPEQLNAKIAWADAERPDYLVLLISSYLTNNARTWLEQIRQQKSYQIRVIEGPELKNLLIRFPALIEEHFATDRYERLLLDAKRHRQTYNITPSYELLYALASHIDPARLTLNDLGFLFMSLYKDYEYHYERNDYYGDFDPKVFAPFYPLLRELATVTTITLFEPYHDNYSYLSGSGFWDDMERWDPGFEGESEADYQYNALHLNNRGPNDRWAVGHYLFFRIASGEAFEIFSIDDSEFSTGVRFYETVSPATIDDLCLAPSSEDFRQVLKKYALVFQRPPKNKD
jgi:hypothetical protein